MVEFLYLMWGQSPLQISIYILVLMQLQEQDERKFAVKFYQISWSIVKKMDVLEVTWIVLLRKKMQQNTQKRLCGILISTTPVQGSTPFLSPPLPPYEERYKVIGYADDVKPAISTMEEFLLVDKAMAFFEKASGCKLHRDPANKKCKFLPLARWRGTLE